MKVIKTWNLSGEDEFDEKHSLYVNNHAEAMLFFISNFGDYLRQQHKYPPDDMSDETFNKIEEIREKFFALSDEHGLYFEKLGV